MTAKQGIVGLVIALALGLSTRANAITGEVIFDNGAPGGQIGFFSVTVVQQIADDFVLQPGQSVITDVHWWGGYSLGNQLPDVPDNFNIRIFEDDNGLPATNPLHDLNVGAANRTATGNLIGSIAEFEYWVEISPISLLPNTTYWLSIINQFPLPSPETDVWSWEVSSLASVEHAFRGEDGQPWLPGEANGIMAFFLTGPSGIPEPLSATALLLGSMLLAARRRR